MTQPPQGPEWGPVPTGTPPTGEPPKKRKVWPLVLGGFVIVFVLLVIIGSIAGKSDDSEAAAPSTTTAAPTTTTTAPTTTAAAPAEKTTTEAPKPTTTEPMTTTEAPKPTTTTAEAAPPKPLVEVPVAFGLYGMLKDNAPGLKFRAVDLAPDLVSARQGTRPRNVIDDNNWMVVAQCSRGQSLPEGSTVVVGVVKSAEKGELPGKDIVSGRYDKLLTC